MVKDPIMKIKKKPKSKGEYNDISGKSNTENNGDVINELNTSDIKSETTDAKKRKKHKKEKLDVHENEQPVKKLKGEVITQQTVLPNIPSENGKELKTVTQEACASDQEPSRVGHSNRKDTLMARLRNTSVHINGVLSLLHIPKHKNQGADDSDDDGKYDGKFTFKT